MKVLVDTCVWSHALRHKNPDKNIIKKLSDLINDGRAVLIGPIKQELLSGMRPSAQFEKLKDILSSFEEIQLKNIHFEKAAEFCNVCRSKGVQGSTIDFLICSVAHSENMIIFTIDKDFENYAKYLPIKLIE
ncbi:MAG: PIN domain-containing protein [Actinobacteria bacterium]|nr:PIN domain-containing protein [Actinomycetota bacterium]